MKNFLIVIMLLVSNIALCNTPYDIRFKKINNGFSATIYKTNGRINKIKLTKPVIQKTGFGNSLPFWLSATITNDREVIYSYTYLPTVARGSKVPEKVIKELKETIQKEIKGSDNFTLKRI